MSDPLIIAVASFEIVLVFAGLGVLWRLGLSPAARRARPPPALSIWEASLPDFLRFVMLVLCGTFVAASAASLALPHLAIHGDARVIFSGAAAQLGMLGGILIDRLITPAAALVRVPRPRRALLTGTTTFLIALPILTATGLVWQGFIKLTGLPADKQDLIDMFADANSPVLLTIMIALAVVLAPVTEELVFRAGFFRYLRTRVSRPLALLVPAFLFALLHANISSFAPLVALAVVFSLAYERTGDIGTSMVAHALFNLNTIVLILSGVGDIT